MVGMPQPTWSRLLTWSNYRFTLWSLPTGANNWYAGYLGLSLCLFALIGIGLCLFWRRYWIVRMVCGAVLGLGLSLLLVFGHQWPVLRDLSAVQAFNAGRFLLFVSFFLAVLVGIGVRLLLVLNPRFGGLAVLLIVADLGPTTFQHPYMALHTPVLNLPETIQRTFEEECEALSNDQLPGYRVMYTAGPYVVRAKAVSWPAMHFSMPSAIGCYDEHPRALRAFSLPAESIFGSELKRWDGQGRIPEQVEQLQFLLNIRWVLTLQVNADGLGFVLMGTQEVPSPIAVAPEVVNFPFLSGSEEDVFQALDIMDVDAARGSCARLLIPEIRARRFADPNPEVSILSHQVFNQHVDLEVEVSAACFARLAYAYYPYLQVIVDGEITEPMQTSDRFIALELSAGKHRIVLQPRLSPLRQWLAVLSLSLLIASVLIWCRALIRSERS